MWFARYDVQRPEDFSEWIEWKFLQYTSSGQVPGIMGNVDLNEFNGSINELEPFRIDSYIG